MKWVFIKDEPKRDALYVTKSLIDIWDLHIAKNELYFAPNGKWYLAKFVYEKNPEKSLSGIIEWLDESEEISNDATVEALTKFAQNREQ